MIPVRSRAHPRSRGENLRVRRSPMHSSGSSPLTRGKRRGRNLDGYQDGLIPAHAGKTNQRDARFCCQRAHPRSRGENQTTAIIVAICGGSSPLTRGKLGNRGARATRPGLIPAHAGKTLWELAPDGAAWAHPRSRGENRVWPQLPESLQGSSPLTRGKHLAADVIIRVDGLIPAHAGKTFGDLPGEVVAGAHPRSRGENVYQVRKSVSVRGSSPLTRGKRPPSPVAHWPPGLIPAHAGKTSSAPAHSSSNPAHPRSRGENTQENACLGEEQGSSPLTRGKRCRVCVGFRPVGLIPAHAGKTFRRRGSGPPPRAHPRSRGENA